ncbi:TPA: hypothetical protein I6187_002171 [Vibrio cholerae]|uniref:DUF7024 domain-containing protein n=1 Tax=Vibrio cholerae TaxID=666 RepID=UPI000615EDDE|nr:hypothetical protein [Vibrio cholerae]AKB03926.1 putative membrane protein [Vibrio cholerae]EGR2418603.1 hypothetical protein [Vibrio cholerae]EJL6273766.1 hypothetical protein [Vibrio cholerae]EKF9247771.1 hypothetical protein [Vibrio cholerae]EKF9477234.1 hypothetical protein [Vibrio cholerae]
MIEKLKRNDTYYGMICLLIFGTLTFYVFHSYKFLLNSDSAVKVILSQVINSEHSILPDKWIYVNGDIWLGLLVYPLCFILSLIDDYFLAYAMNSIFYIFISIVLVEVLIRELNVDKLSCWIVRAFFISSLSPNYADFLFGEIAYIPMLILYIAEMILLIKLANEKTLQSKVSFVCLTIIIVVFLQNPTRHIVFSLFPFVGSLAFMYFCQRISMKTAIKGSLLVLVSFIISFIFYYFLSKEAQFSNGVGSLLLASMTQFNHNLDLFFAGLFSFSGIMIGGVESSSTTLAYGFLVFFSAVYFLNRVLTRKKESNVFYAIRIFTILFFIIVFYLYICTVPLAQNERTFRYFYPVYWGVFIMSSLYIYSLDKAKKVMSGYFVLIVLLSGSIYSYVKYPTLSKIVEPYKEFQDVSNFLNSHGYEKGFATYWNAYRLKVISNNPAPILPIHESLEPFYWLVDKDQFRPDKSITKSFLLLAPDEKYLVTNKDIAKYGSSKEFVSGYTLLMFDFDVSEIVYGRAVELPDLGLDFSNPILPSYIHDIKGFSHAEPEFRWSEGKRTEVKYYQELPQHFVLQIELSPYGENTNELLTIRVGEIEKSVRLLPGKNTYHIGFSDVEANDIEFIIPKPVQPSANGKVIDPRFIGVSFFNMSIVENKF